MPARGPTGGIRCSPKTRSMASVSACCWAAWRSWRCNCRPSGGWAFASAGGSTCAIRAWRELWALMWPSVIAGSAVQVNVLVNGMFASEINGGQSWLACAFRLMQFPIGLFGVSLATATLPAVTRAHARGDMAAFAATARDSLRLAWFLALPAAAGLAALAHPLIGLIYQHGRFSARDTEQTALALQAYAIGLAGYAAIKVLVPCFYALGRAQDAAAHQPDRHRRQPGAQPHGLRPAAAGPRRPGADHLRRGPGQLRPAARSPCRGASIWATAPGVGVLSRRAACSRRSPCGARGLGGRAPGRRRCRQPAGWRPAAWRRGRRRRLDIFRRRPPVAPRGKRARPGDGRGRRHCRWRDRAARRDHRGTACRPTTSTTSSSAPGRPAACWPTG